jgi:hypothetical protein
MDNQLVSIFLHNFNTLDNTQAAASDQRQRQLHNTQQNNKNPLEIPSMFSAMVLLLAKWACSTANQNVLQQGEPTDAAKTPEIWCDLLTS